MQNQAWEKFLQLTDGEGNHFQQGKSHKHEAPVFAFKTNALGEFITCFGMCLLAFEIRGFLLQKTLKSLRAALCAPPCGVHGAYQWNDNIIKSLKKLNFQY